jgi:hypothetical protein
LPPLFSPFAYFIDDAIADAITPLFSFHTSFGFRLHYAMPRFRRHCYYFIFIFIIFRHFAATAITLFATPFSLIAAIIFAAFI